MKRKVCVITGTRAEYGLLYWVIKGLDDDPEVELQIIATGMHLSPEFGLTYKNIEQDGFEINSKVEMLLSSDTSVGISKSIGLGVIGFAESFDTLKPDIAIVLGDRFEVLAASVAATIGRIPLAHCHGGEATEGLIDEPIRHSVTKMSHVHFTATEEYRKRVIQLGESPATVFNVGALGIENINKLDLLDRPAFEEAINFKLNKRNLLVTYHPVTLETATAEEQFKNLLEALDDLQETNLIFTKPNADSDGRVIIDLIDEFVAENKDKAIAFTSLGQLRYLSALKYMDGVVGNSSSGLIEAPSFKIGTVNIGDRQKGRIRGESVIDCEPSVTSIKGAIDHLYDQKFKELLVNIVNPYGEGNPSEKIIDTLKSVRLENILKKSFYNIPFELQ